MPNWRSTARRAGRALAAAVGGASLLLVQVAPRAMADTPAASTHIVQPGETLSTIADSVGVDSATLLALNALDDANLLRVGQTINLPPAGAASVAAAPASSAATAATAPRTYTVVAGDTLWAVAQQFATTTAALFDANHLDDPDHLRAGTQLVVPGSAAGGPAAAAPPTNAAPAPGLAGAAPADAPPAAASAPPPADAPPGPTTPATKRSLKVSYTVQPGETLNHIAHQFDVAADAIAQANGIDDPNRLSVGSVLRISLPGREHVVQAGETLRDIAAQEKVDLGSLIDFNTLDDPQLIHIGQVILVPAAPSGQTAASTEEQPVGKPAAAGPSSPAPSSPAPSNPAPKPAPAKPTAAQASKPAVPAASVSPPPGSPSDGLAGAGLKLLGAAYVWGGSNPSGFDCSGFVWYIARQAGKQISRGMLGEYNAGAHPARDGLKPGDLVFFQNTYTAGLSHTGIYIGNGQFVHAADEAVGVTVSNLSAAYWSSHWFGATRLP